MTTLYISPTGAGLQDGSSIANAAPLKAISLVIGAAGPDGQVLMLADQGNYTLDGLPIIIAAGGTDGHPVTVRGIDSQGNSMRASIVGTRSDPFDSAGAAGEQVFCLTNGADNLTMSDLSFTNIGYGAFRVGGDIRNLTIQHVDGTNVQRFFEDYVTGTNTTATISGLTIRDANINGFSRGAIRLAYDTNNVVIDNVHGDGQYQDEPGASFSEGVHLEGTAHNILISNSSMRNNKDSLSGAYWNGDGFATESGVYNVHFQNTVSTGNADGGYDIKSTSTVLDHAVAEDNGRDFRVWANDTVLSNVTSVDPHLRGGISSQNDIWFNRGGSATLINPVISDKTSNTAINLTEGHSVANVTNLVALIAPTVTLFKSLSGSVYNVDHVDYGTAVSSGASYADSTAGVALYANDSTDHVITGGHGNDVIRGGAGNDVLIGGDGNNTLIGGDGNDVLVPGNGVNVLLGQGGFDTVDYSNVASGVQVDLGGAASGGGAAGDVLDSIEGLIGSAFADVLSGDAGDNVLKGGAGDDILNGGAGNDVLVGGPGADTLIGGPGIDTADYSTSSAAVTVDLGTGLGHGGDAEGDHLSGIEILVGSAFDDTLIGGAGDTRFIGGPGADTLIGGAGISTADYSTNSQGVQIDLAAGTSAGGDAAGDRLFNINVIVGTAFDDVIHGDALANTLIGGAGNDVLDGGGGNDILIGGPGADTLIGGDGIDTVDYSSNAVGVIVDLVAGTAAGGDANGDTLQTIENVVGTAFADTLIGDGHDNVLTGGAGDDVLIGGGGADLLIGGPGIDTASYANAPAGITLNLVTGVGTGDAAGDVLQDIEIVVGSGYDDIIVAGGTVHALYGGAGNDRLIGSDGNDLLVGGAGADVIDGGAGIDTVDYSASPAAVLVNLALGFGQGGDAEGDQISNVERVIGSSFNDTLIGSGQHSVLIGGAGADTLIGGTGFDTADYSASSAAVTVNLATGQGSGGDAEGDTLIGIHGLVGSAFNDHLTGGPGDDVLAGGLGADVLVGGGGNDTADYSSSLVAMTVNLAAGTASDGDTLSGISNVIGAALASNTLIGDANNNTLTGGAGNDIIDGGAGADVMIGGLGNDTYTVDNVGDVVIEDAGGGTDRVNTSLDSYTLPENVESLGYVGTGSFTGYGNELDNTFYGTAGSETFYGYAGDDNFQGSLGADTFYGGLGSNMADYSKSPTAVTVNLITNVNIGGYADGDKLYDVHTLSGSNYSDDLSGDNLDNTIYARGGNDVLHGYGGNDKLDGGTGADIMFGGTGDDLYVVDNPGDQVIEYANEGYDTVSTSLDSYVLPANIEALVASTVRVFTGTGNELDNSITGGSNADWLYGMGGNDTLIGGGGADHLFGGDGSDTASYVNSLVAVSVNLATGQNHGGDAEGDVLSSIENITGSSHNDTLTGDDGANILLGGAGDDTLVGNGGNDTLDGGSGADTMTGGTGDDIYYVDNPADIVIEDANAGNDTVITSLASYTLGANVENLVATGIAAFVGTGNGLDNSITGSAGNDNLYGLDGNDTLDGGAGADYLDGGAGFDTVTYAHSSAGVMVDLTTGLGTGGDAQGDVLVSIENLIGSAFADQLNGDNNANVLSGGAGDDMLSGGSGNDLLIGGAGNDAIDGGAGIDTAQFSGARGDYMFSFHNGVLSVSDMRAGAPDGVDTITGIEYFQFLGGITKPVGAIGGTIGNDSLTGTAAADVFFYDTAEGLQLGSDAINKFGAGDRLVTTSAIAGANAAGMIRPNSSDRYILPGANNGDAGESTGGVKIFSTSGRPLSSITLLATETHNGVTYYSYGVAGDTAAAQPLNFGDIVAPAVGIAVGAATLSDATPSETVTFTFNEAPVGFTVADVVATNGTIANFAVSASNPLVYSAVFTAADGYSGQATLGIAAGSFTDTFSNPSTAAASASIAVDTLNPTLAIAASQSMLSAGQTATLTFTFSEAPTGFTRDDIVVGSGTLGMLTGTPDAKVYTIDYTPGANVHDPAMKVSVAGGTYMDAIGNAGIAALTSLSVDTTPVANNSFTGTAGGDTFTATTDANWTINGLAGDDVLTGAGGADTIMGGDGNDRITGAGGNDLIDGGTGIDTVVFNGSRADYAFSFYQGSISIQDLRAGSPDGTDTVVNVEQAQFLGGGNKPVGAIEGTYANHTLVGTDGNDIFLFDTAIGFSLGGDTIKGFNPGDRFVTTSQIYDKSNSGRVGANSSDTFVLPGTVSGASTESTGTVKLFNSHGTPITSIVLESTVVDHGISYYVYAATGDTAAHASLHF